MKKPKSRWMVDEDGDVRCAACHEELPYVITSRATFDALYPRKNYIVITCFCPNCGVEMEAEQESEDCNVAN